MSNNLGSRQTALRECESAGPGTVGAVIAKILNLPIMSLTVKYEIASDGIGAFYQRPEIRVLLRSYWTDANLRELARVETEFYKTQTGSAGVVGRIMTAEGRFIGLREARDRLF